MDTFTPAAFTPPETVPVAALLMLKNKLQVDLTVPFNDPHDARHELAVLLVDLGRRYLDLRADLNERLDEQMVRMAALNSRAIAVDDFSRDQPEDRDYVASADVLLGRLSELDRTLAYALVAYKQAWWANTTPAAGEPEVAAAAGT